MADEIGAPETQVDSATQPPAGTSTTQADGETGEQPTQPETISLEEAKKLRSEANSLRKRLKAFEEQAKADEDAKLSEQERNSKRITELESQLAERERSLRERTIRSSTVVEAAKLGFADPEDALRLLDQDAIEIDDEGTPVNVAAQLASLAKSKPYLLNARPTGSFDTGLGGGRQAGARTYTRQELRDPVFFAEHKDDIVKAQREGRIA